MKCAYVDRHGLPPVEKGPKRRVGPERKSRFDGLLIPVYTVDGMANGKLRGVIAYGPSEEPQNGDRRQSGHLFSSSNLFVYVTAATLGHHALEMYLKSALICEGMTVFNPVILKSLDPGYALTRSNCAW